MWLVDTSVRRPVAAVMMSVSLVVLGWISLGRLGVDLFPAVEFPYVSITTRLEGAGPDAVETEVTDVIEEHVNTISGIKKLRSVSAEGLSQVFIEFELNENADAKAQDARDKVSLAQNELPEDAKVPVVEKVDPDAAPILSVMIAGDLPIGELTTFADHVVKESIQRLPGVGSVAMVGGRKREIRIWLDGAKMRSFGVTAADVAAAVRSENAETPGGRLEVGGARREYGVKTMAEARSAAEFAALVVAFQSNGAPTHVGDVARVEDGLEDERSFAQLNGRPGVSLDVRRQSGRNTVQVAREVKAEVARLVKIAPPGIDIIVARDVSRFIESSIRDVLFDLSIAVVLVVAITFLFLLSMRATLIVALAIPTSLISTFFVFYLFGFTLNILTLLALTVAIGLLVDDAIVVIESIQRDVDAGRDSSVAAVEGSERVGLAVLAGTFATLAVFVPIAFMSGIVGRFFMQYGLAIVFSVSVSLLVALTLTPMLASRFLQPAASHWRVLKPIERFHKYLERAYARIVKGAVKWRYLVILIGFSTVMIGGWFAKHVPMGFTSKSDRSEFLGSLELPLGFGMLEGRGAALTMDQALHTVEHVRDVFITVGAGSQGKVNRIDLYATITPKQQRDVSQFIVMDAARAAVAKAVPLAQKITIAEVSWISGGGVSSSDIELVFRGSDLEELQTSSADVATRLADLPSLVDIHSTYEEGRPELQISIDRLRAGNLGVGARTLATTARTLIGGEDVGTFEDKGKRYDVRLRLDEDQRQNLSQLGLIQMRAANGRLIDLASVARIDFARGPSQIDRQDRARKISISAGVASSVALGTATADIERMLAAHPVPASVQISYEGMSRRMNESAAAIGFAFGLALIALYIVLASQFDSFVQPLITMVTAPLCFSGAFAAIYFGHMELSMFAQIGLIALMGIVMKNGILLVDRANQIRATGIGAAAAMVQAAPERLRPVLMTAFAAVFGMLPVAFANSDGAEWRNAMGFIIIGGLSSSTLLTLLVVPAVYAIQEDVTRLGGVLRRVRSRRSARVQANSELKLTEPNQQ